MFFWERLLDRFSSRHRLQQRDRRQGIGSGLALLRSGSSVSSPGLCHSTRRPGENDNDDIEDDCEDVVVVVVVVVPGVQC